MSNKAQIIQQTARDGVPAPTVERDYILTHIIAGLDFSIINGNLSDAYAVITDALKIAGGAIETLCLTNNDPAQSGRQTFYNYSGRAGWLRR